MSPLGEWVEPNPSDAPGTAARGDAADATAQLVFTDVHAFVRDYVAPTYRRHLDGGRTRTWCPQWWAHPEALLRLEALWRAWEYLRTEPTTGISVWLRDHADHHMLVLLDPQGPFKGCSPEKGHSDRLGPLPVLAPGEPDGLGPDRVAERGG